MIKRYALNGKPHVWLDVGGRALCRRCRIAMALAGVLLLAQNLSGAEWHVNNKASNASDSNPGTEAAPFLTINAATTNKAFQAGDTVWVHPGVYDSGVVSDNVPWPTRVY